MKDVSYLNNFFPLLLIKLQIKIKACNRFAGLEKERNKFNFLKFCLIDYL